MADGNIPDSNKMTVRGVQAQVNRTQSLYDVPCSAKPQNGYGCCGGGMGFDATSPTDLKRIKFGVRMQQAANGGNFIQSNTDLKINSYGRRNEPMNDAGIKLTSTDADSNTFSKGAVASRECGYLCEAVGFKPFQAYAIDVQNAQATDDNAIVVDWLYNDLSSGAGNGCLMDLLLDAILMNSSVSIINDQSECAQVLGGISDYPSPFANVSAKRVQMGGQAIPPFGYKPLAQALWFPGENSSQTLTVTLKRVHNFPVPPPTAVPAAGQQIWQVVMVFEMQFWGVSIPLAKAADLGVAYCQ